MRDHKFQLRVIAIVVTIVSVAIFPMVTSIALADNVVHAEDLGQPFDFTPNVKQLELTSIAATAVAEGVEPPTLPFGPGQLYSEENKPKVSHIEDGDEEFGYGPSKEDPDVYVVWMTDQNGTHYFTVAADSNELLGTLDEATNSRAKNGYVHVIADRDLKLQEVIDMEEKADRHQNLRMGSHGTSLGTAVVGAIVCGFLTGGTCIVAFGVAAVGAWALGVQQNGEKLSAQDSLERLEGQLSDIDTHLQGKFGQAMRVEPGP